MQITSAKNGASVHISGPFFLRFNVSEFPHLFEHRSGREHNWYVQFMLICYASVIEKQFRTSKIWLYAVMLKPYLNFWFAKCIVFFSSLLSLRKSVTRSSTRSIHLKYIFYIEVLLDFFFLVFSCGSYASTWSRSCFLPIKVEV